MQVQRHQSNGRLCPWCSRTHRMSGFAHRGISVAPWQVGGGKGITKAPPNTRNRLAKRAYDALWSSTWVGACVLHGGKSRGMQVPTESSPLRETVGIVDPGGSSPCPSHFEYVYDLRLKD